ncbi:MAG: hypothetical protein ACK4GN_18455 [Runella sp.]
MFRKILCYLLLLLLGSACTSTQQQEDTLQSLEKKADKLADSEAFIEIRINEQEFYPNQQPFRCIAQILPQGFKASLIDTSKANVELDCIANGWIERKPHQFILKNQSIGQASGDQVIVMIGKLKKTPMLTAEGYLMAEGKMEFKQLSKSRLIISLEGFVIKPGNANIPENYLPLRGYIFIKNPRFTPKSDSLLLSKLP